MKYYTVYRPHHSIEYLQRAVDAGIQGFEIKNLKSYLPQEEYASYLERLQSVRERLGVNTVIHAPILDVTLGSLNRRVRNAAINEVKDSIDLAKELGSTVVVVHGMMGILTMPPGEWSKQVYRPTREERELVEKQDKNVVQALKECADYAPNIILAVENLVFPHEMYRSPEEMEELLYKVNRPNVGITLDIGHAAVSGYRASEYLNRLSEHIFHVHLHDNHGVIDEHLPLGEGTLDYIGIIHNLMDSGYPGAVTFEFSLENPEEFRQYILKKSE